MAYNKSPKGAEWRRWDLHIHTPETKLSNCYGNDDNVWNNYIDFLERSPVSAFGITDYFCADGYYKLVQKYRDRHPNSDKVFFLNIEFRLAEAISKDNKNPHIHVIFDNDAAICPESTIRRFLSSLQTLDENVNGVAITCSDLSTSSQFESASITIENLKDALKKTFGESKPYLIAFPAKNDGVRSTDSSSPRKVLITDKIDRMSDFLFGDASSKQYFLGGNRYDSGESAAKPVVSGSDAHSFVELERLEGNVAGFEPTWIKCDLTFRGLQQICFEPDARVYIGSEPLVEVRKRNQATKFISELKINKIPEYDGSNGEWFNELVIPLNPELTVIVGNKGSGKSALVDVIGLLADSKQHDYFSFLSDRGTNKKFRQRGYAENFEAELFWLSSPTDPIKKKLDEKINLIKPESVRYLPQNYFEQLTNEIEIEEFRREIEDVVFSHVEDTDRMGKASFSELQEFKTQQSKHETNSIEARLHDINADIFNCEEQADPSFKKQLEAELKVKLNELDSLELAKPQEVAKPEIEDPQQKVIADKINSLTEINVGIEKSGNSIKETVTHKKSRLQNLNLLLQGISTAYSNFESQKAALKITCDDLGIDINVVLNSEINTTPIVDSIAELKGDIGVLERDNKISFSEDFDMSTLGSLPDLRQGYSYINSLILNLKTQLDTPQRKYQAYVEKLAEWNVQKNGILGNPIDPKPGTIEYLKSKISFLSNELKNKLSQLLLDRRIIVKNIFDSKRQVLTFYSELKVSVEERLGAVHTDNFSVEIDASFVLDRGFIKEFLNYIMKNRSGVFHGANNPEKVLSDLSSNVDWNEFDSIYNFLEDILCRLKNYKDEYMSVAQQVSNAKEFYDYIFSLSYFSAKYELRLGGKNLNELSPGEKGLLLLVFYLQLDKDDIPLVIDQPEDNLDNESIYTVLANCIRDAKKNRQVILVTHNPNLAVGADAEQVVYVKLEKANNYKFSYESGAIENPKINQRIVDILEGSQPAFLKRRLKYQM